MKRFLSLFLSLVLIFPVIPVGMVLAVDSTAVNFTVDPTAATSSTVFNKIQDAINAVPANNTSATPYVIQVKNGTYIENINLNKNWVTLAGESETGVVLTSSLPDVLYINDAGYIKFRKGGSTYDTSTEYTPTVLTLSSSDCTIQNVTIKLDQYYIDMGPISAVTTTTSAQRNSFKYCTLAGGQDTLYDNGRTYYYKCTISGSVDFMYGGASSVFDSCDIKSIYWERLYNMSEVNGVISYGLSASDLTSRGITSDDIALWTTTDPQRAKYPNIVNGPNFRTAPSSKPTDFAAPDFTRILNAEELKALTDAELSSRQIARDSSNNPDNWKTIAELTASDSKRLKSVGSGYLTACSTPQTSLGFLYINCNLIGDSRLNPGSYALGRPWRSYAQATYVNCKMGPHIAATGWNNWGNTANESTARYEEYGTTNLDGSKYDLSKRYTWAKILTDVEVLSRNPYNYLKGTDGWDPTNQASYYNELNNIANNLSINSVQYVSTNLDLPTTDAASGAAIQWLSSNTSLINNTGLVNRPAYNGENQNVTLTAVVTKDGRGVLKDFALTVLKAPDANTNDPDYLACLDAYAALQTGVIPVLNLSAIKNDLVLPTTGINGTTLEWKSNNPSITDAGKVTRPAATAEDASGTLQLTIRKNQAAVAYNLDTTVIKYLNPVAGLYKSEDFVGVGIGGATGTSSYNYSTNVFSISGTGTGFTKTMVDPDQFYLNGVLMTGDFTISAKITGLTASGPTVGLTIRDSLEPLSYHVTQTWQLPNKTRKMYRYSGSVSGSNEYINSLPTTGTAYIQLTKKGSTITTIASSAQISQNPIPTTSNDNVKVNTFSNTNIGKDASGNDKEIYTGFVVNGGASVTFQDVKIVTSAGAVVFDSNAQPPMSPKYVIAASGDKSGTITWDAISNATSYTVKQGTSAQGPFAAIQSDITSVDGRMQAKISNLENDKTYYYVVTASNSNGESSSSTVVSVTPAVTDTTPPVITMISASPASQVYGASLSLSGSVDEASTLTIEDNGNLAKLDGDNTSLSLSKNGTFSNTLTLIEGVNKIEIKAVDIKGNITTQSYTVNYTKIKPEDFVGVDIGSPAIAGSSSFDDDTNLVTLTAAGSGISKNVAGPDQFYLKAVKMKGDYTISAKINVVNYTDAFIGSMGLTVRESLESNSYHFTQMESYGIPDAGRKMFRYSKADGSITSNGSNYNMPLQGSAYLRLTKKGNSITSVISLDPITENPVVSDRTSINTADALGLGLDVNGNPKELYAGLMLTSSNISHSVSATYEDVKIVMADGTVAFDANEGKPIAPKNVVTKPYDKSATITWDALQTATSYTVKQSTSAEGPFTPVESIITSENGKVKALVSGLENEKTYYYVVTASNASGESVPTKVVSVTPSASVLIPPAIRMTSADPASEVFSALLPLSGTVDKASTLTIKQNGNLVKLDGDSTSLYLSKNGAFNNTLILIQGLNTIEIKAVDDYGFETSKNYEVNYTYKIANINFYDTNNNVVTSLTPGEDIVVQAAVENYVDPTRDLVLVVGLYDEENNLVKFIYSAEKVSYGESEVFYTKFMLPDDVSGYTLKAYVWNNFVSIRPTSDVASLK